MCFGFQDGVHLDSITQKGTKLEIRGSAESNTRVSAFMRNIDTSAWLERPDLQVVEVRGSAGKGSRASEFTVIAYQVRVKNEEEDS